MSQLTPGRAIEYTGGNGDVAYREHRTHKEREARAAQETSALSKWQREQLAASLTNAALVVNMYISMILGRTLEDYQKDPRGHQDKRRNAAADRPTAALLS
jgi:hypothetical protein